MTNFLLGSILFLLAADMLIRAWVAREDARRNYTTPCEVENIVKVVNADDPFDMKQMLEQMSAEGYELVSTHQPNLAHLYLFFTRKKIKTYYE